MSTETFIKLAMINMMMNRIQKEEKEEEIK